MKRRKSAGRLKAREGVVLLEGLDGVVVVHRRRCLDCGGEGEVEGVEGSINDPDARCRLVPCEECAGEGHIDDEECRCAECLAAMERLAHAFERATGVAS